MESENDGNAARFQDGRQHRGHHALQVFQFIVDRNPQCLKDSGRRVSAAFGSRLWDGCTHAVFEILSCFNGVTGSVPADVFRNLSGERFITEFPEDTTNLLLIRSLQEVCSRDSARHIEPHIQRPASIETESASAILQLI